MATYDSALSDWPVPYEEWYVPERFGSSHVIASGPVKAPPLILLSGAGTSSVIWFSNIEGLSRRFRVYLVDIPGDAGKSLLNIPLISRRDCADWLASVMDGLRVPRAYLAGISYGGWLAINMALLEPERVKKAALIAAPGFVPLGEMFYKVFFSVTLLPFRPVTRAILRKLSTRRDKEFDRWADMMSIFVKHGKPRRVIPTIFNDMELRSCQAPVLFMAGEKENLYDAQAVFARGKALIKDFKYAVIPGAGHVVNIDQPEMVDERLIDFFDK